MAKKTKITNENPENEKDITTEEKIKAAALKLFQQKGFAGTKTRDIAEEAGINIALLNYYFRSKEKLFEIIMEESLHKIFFRVKSVLEESGTSLEEKVECLASNYIDILIENPYVPLFILSEIQSNVTGFVDKHKMFTEFISKQFADNSNLIKQIKGELQVENPMHIILNIISLSVFPFVAKPLWLMLTQTDSEEFTEFMKERKKLIPKWIKNMI